MKFSETHEWIKVEGSIGTVGITHFAQKELKEIVSIQLPPLGKKVKMGEEAAILESTKAAVDIYSPVSGEIIAVNEAALQNFSLVNESPEEGGWLFKIQLQKTRELDTLLDLEQYLQLVSVS
ncbi:MAG TPA: glycine cleavage system protein GcvH [Rhabdochlamydiaceae bacterium]|nr:glycine cleavage system protein GcvH [Rhabdochlamydiaceae bacterium]